MDEAGLTMSACSAARGLWARSGAARSEQRRAGRGPSLSPPVPARPRPPDSLARAPAPLPAAQIQTRQPPRQLLLGTHTKPIVLRSWLIFDLSELKVCLAGVGKSGGACGGSFPLLAHSDHSR